MIIPQYPSDDPIGPETAAALRYRYRDYSVLRPGDVVAVFMGNPEDPTSISLVELGIFVRLEDHGTTVVYTPVEGTEQYSISRRPETTLAPDGTSFARNEPGGLFLPGYVAREQRRPGEKRCSLAQDYFLANGQAYAAWLAEHQNGPQP